MASVVDICNGALNQLGATTILSLTEDSKKNKQRKYCDLIN